jgi:hypothetical protein
MKQLKSSVEDLREIFEKNIAVRHIAEPFCSFDEVADAQKVRDFMNRADYDVVGVRQRGLVTGYVHRTALVQGKIGDHLKKFESHEILPGTAPLLEALKVLADSGRVFALSFGKVSGIITRGDLQKVPIRMWLFGLISLIEMQLLRIIRDRFPYDLWSELLTPGRIEKAQKLLEMRQKRNEAIDLADCLQFCDKREIVVKTKELREELGFSKTALETRLKELEKLRNNLAHAQDVITGNWPGIVDLASSAETFLKKCEGVGSVSNVAA